MTTGVVVMHYGTPSGPDDIERYYTDIRGGRPPSPDQLAELTSRYESIGGVSPLAEIGRAQAAGIAQALAARYPDRRFVVEVGTKHASPSIEAAVAAVIGRGARHVVGLVLAPHDAAASVGVYHDRAQAAAQAGGAGYHGLRSWATLPELVTFLAGEVGRGLEQLPPDSLVVFTAHSLPRASVPDGDPYLSELRATAAAVAEQVGLASTRWTTALQSAAIGSPIPWLGPDVSDVIAAIGAAAAGEHAPAGVLVCPCGFVADHLEVRYDVDVVARQAARDAGIQFARTGSLNAERTVLSALAARIAAVPW